MKYVSEKCRLTRGGILFPPNLNSEKYPLARGGFYLPGVFIKQEKVYEDFNTFRGSTPLGKVIEKVVLK